MRCKINRCLYIFHFFFALLASSTLASADIPWRVEVTKNKDTLAFGDTLHVTICVDYPSSYEPNLFEFLLQQESISDYGYFGLLSSSYENKNSHVVIDLQLQPEKTGTLIFTPGMLSFSPKESSLPLHSLLVSAFSIESKGLFPTPQIMPPLPFNPETAIDINPENYKATFENPELMAKEQKYNLGRSIAKSRAWTALVIIFFIASLVIVIFWFLKEYALLFTKKKLPTKKRALKEEFKALEDSQGPYDNRISTLSELLRAAMSEKEQRKFQGMTSQEIISHLQASQALEDTEKKMLQDLFLKLDAIEFSEKTENHALITDTTWKALLGSSSLLFK